MTVPFFAVPDFLVRSYLGLPPLNPGQVITTVVIAVILIGVGTAVKRFVRFVEDEMDEEAPTSFASAIGPGAESAPWINPAIHVTVKKVIRECLASPDVLAAINAGIEKKADELTDAAVMSPAWLNRLLKTVASALLPRLTALDVGDEAPLKVDAVRTYCTGSESTLLEVVPVDAAVTIDLQPEVAVAFGRFVSTFSVRSRLVLKAPLRLVFAPLLRDEMLFGALQVYVKIMP